MVFNSVLVEEGVRCLSVIRFVFHVLQLLLPIRLMQRDLCYISKSIVNILPTQIWL